jgi:hypothetical protein
LQIAAYAMAHDEVYRSRIRQGVIMICTPDLYYQEFKIQDTELKRWKHKWLARLDAYNDLQREEKKQASIDPTKLLNEFEKDKTS